MMMARPIIFTDIDGTLGSLPRAIVGITAFFPHSIDALNTICKNTTALVGIISARVRITPPKSFENALREAGFSGEFFPVRRSWRPFSRHDDILTALNASQTPLSQVVIFDNRALGYSAPLTGRLVVPKSDAGIGPEHVVQAQQLLGRIGATNALHP